MTTTPGNASSNLGNPSSTWPHIPIGALVIGLTPIFLTESRAPLAERRFDFLGAASITAGLMLLVYGLTRASETSWTSTEPILLLASSALLIATRSEQLAFGSLLTRARRLPGAGRGTYPHRLPAFRLERCAGLSRRRTG